MHNRAMNSAYTVVEGGCINAAKHSSVQQADRTLKAQNSVPTSLCRTPAVAGPVISSALSSANCFGYRLHKISKSIRLSMPHQFHSGAESCNSLPTNTMLSNCCCSISAEYASSRSHGMSKSSGAPPMGPGTALSKAIRFLKVSKRSRHNARSLLPGRLTRASIVRGRRANRRYGVFSWCVKPTRLRESSEKASLWMLYCRCQRSNDMLSVDERGEGRGDGIGEY
jgi:hypothetical protein